MTRLRHLITRPRLRIIQLRRRNVCYVEGSRSRGGAPQRQSQAETPQRRFSNAREESVAEDAHGDDAAKRSDAEEAGREDAEDAHGDDAEARSPEDAEGENEAVDDEMGENEEEGAAVPDPSPPVKRPRGRPKKTVSEVPPVEAGEETRRKRGRPSGSRRSFI